MKDLIYNQLKELLKVSYAPYSKFHTAAIVVTDNGNYEGCNIENASYSLTVCAERCAIFNAIAHKAKKFQKLYLISSSKKKGVVPCGACMQVIIEFFSLNASIVVYTYNGDKTIYKVKDLLPKSFTKQELSNAKK